MKPITFVRVTVAFVLFGLFWAWPLQSEEESSPNVRVELLSEAQSIEGGKPFWVAIHMELDSPWHVYWKNPGDVGLPVAVLWDLPLGFKAGDLKWPHPKREETPIGIHYVHDQELWLLAKITPPETLKEGSESKIKARIRYLTCSEENCLPGKAKVMHLIPHSKETKLSNDAAQIKKHREALPTVREDIQVSHYSDGTVELRIIAADQEIESAYFCPLIHGTIDDSEGVKISVDSPHVLRIKAKERLDRLKGTLVLTMKDGSTEAWDLAAPVVYMHGDTDEIAMADLSPSRTIAADVPVIEFSGGVLWAVILAFGGGIILNLMPCVLPVISLKVFSFMKMAGQSRAHVFKHGLLFTAGVLVSFWALAGALLGLQAYGHAVGWGFQLQEPIFVAVLASLLFLFAMSQFGVFELGTSVASWAGQVDSNQAAQSDSQESASSSFLSGILATAVATPCTGPFLGTAVGFAVTQPPHWALLVFTSLGLGMAFPYLLLSAFPSFLRFMPKPGPWMVAFREFLGFCLLATILWLLWVFGAQTGMMPVFILLFGLFFYAIASWIYGKWGSPIRKPWVRRVGTVFALAFFSFASFVVYQSTLQGPSEYDQGLVAMADGSSEKNPLHEWHVFDPEHVKALQKQGTPVLVDFTARWCLICQANHLVLASGSARDRLDEAGVVRMQADWTRRNPMITEQLALYGRNSVPLYLLFPGEEGAEPIVLPQVLTPDAVSDAIDSLGLNSPANTAEHQ